MGSRRKRKEDRLSAGAGSVTRQARGEVGPALATARGRTSSSSARAAVSSPSHSAHSAAPDTGKHAAVGSESSRPARTGPDTGKHARVGLVTKQTDDGSYELVYEAIEEPGEDELAQGPEAPTPLWKRRGVLIGAAVAALLLIVGAVIVVVSTGSDNPRKVASSDKPKAAAAASDEDTKDKPRYEYVPPKKPEGQLADGEGEDKDLPETTTSAKGRNPGGAADPGDALNAPGPGYEGAAVAPAPSGRTPMPNVDLKPRIPSINTDLRRPLDPRTRGAINKRFKNINPAGGPALDPTGAPIEDGDDEEEGDDQEEIDGDEEEIDGDEEEEGEDEEDDEEEDEEGDDDEEEEEEEEEGEGEGEEED